MIKSLIGDKRFYRMALMVALPIMVQNAITNFVGMLDNIMVGQVGTAQMSGVSIVNQLIFVFNLCVFGAVSGAGIFTAQFSGRKNHEGIRYTLRFKLLVCIILTALGVGIFLLWGEPLIRLYLTGEGDAANAELYLAYGKDYLLIMLFGLLPFALNNAYASTLRETGQTLIPMVGGIIAVFVNLILNYILILGKLGAPAMGVEGAAIATVVSRYVELAFVAGWTHLNHEKAPYSKGIYRSFRIPVSLTKKIIAKSMPLLLNEFLWASGMAVLNQCYSVRSLDVVPAINIANTIWNVFSVSFLAMGNAVGIIMGQKLGANESREHLKDTNRKLIAFSIMICLFFGVALASISGAFPRIYKTTDDIRGLAGHFIRIGALFMPFCAYANAAYFTLRSGGKTFITFLFDSCFVWVVCIPLIAGLVYGTMIPIVPLYFIGQATEMVKCFVGGFIIRKGTWMQNVVQSAE